MAAWLRGPLRNLVAEHLTDGPLFNDGWFERRAFSALVRDHMDRSYDHSGAIWPILCLAMWHCAALGDGRPA